jgi:hypothetical protein
VPLPDWIPALPEGSSYVVGQGETGDSGYEHWQFILHTKKKTTLAGVKSILGVRTAHLEATRSSAAKDYVQKDDTRIEGTSFEFGQPPFDRSSVINRLTRKLIGIRLKQARLQEISPTFQRTYTFVVTTSCRESFRIMLDQLRWFAPALFFGDQLEQESQSVPGKKRGSLHTLRIPEQSGGMATRVRQTLSLMNFVEVSTYPICFDGWTATHAQWRRREAICLCKQPVFGSPVTLTPESGLSILTNLRAMHLKDD